LTILEVVREVLRDEHADVIRESVRAVAQELMEAEVIRDGAILESLACTGPTCSELPRRLGLRVLEWSRQRGSGSCTRCLSPWPRPCHSLIIRAINDVDHERDRRTGAAAKLVLRDLESHPVVRMAWSLPGAEVRSLKTGNGTPATWVSVGWQSAAAAVHE
jgi:hypothetical protein